MKLAKEAARRAGGPPAVPAPSRGRSREVRPARRSSVVARVTGHGRRSKRCGAVLITSMIFVVIFSALAVSMATMSGTNVQIANNQHKANCARACSQSGHEIIRLWLSHVSISGLTPPSQRFDLIANSFESTAGDISNIAPCHDSNSITIPSVTLDQINSQSFSAVIRQIDPNTLQVDVTGTCGTLSRTIRVNYKFGARTHTVFDYGVATKGPLSLAGNIELEGVNIAVESDVYIESENSILALSITGNSQIAGDVIITNSNATVDLQGGQAGIGGETGQDAIDNHVSFGEAPVEFPEPNPSYFEQYVQNTVDVNDVTFENIRIPAGTNPSFAGGVTLKGIIFIDTPNIVTFNGNTTITGIIVGNGDIEDDSGTNQIKFLGDVNSLPVSELPDEPQFTGIKNDTGTFLMAPGFAASFGGSFATLNGAIASNGIEFFGDAGGTINGSVINYSDEELSLSGNSDLYFNRSDTVKVPAGFVQDIVLQYDPTSYAEGPF